MAVMSARVHHTMIARAANTAFSRFEDGKRIHVCTQRNRWARQPTPKHSDDAVAGRNTLGDIVLAYFPKALCDKRSRLPLPKGELRVCMNRSPRFDELTDNLRRDLGSQLHQPTFWSSDNCSLSLVEPARARFWHCCVFFTRGQSVSRLAEQCAPVNIGGAHPVQVRADQSK